MVFVHPARVFRVVVVDGLVGEQGYGILSISSSWKEVQTEGEGSTYQQASNHPSEEERNERQAFQSCVQTMFGGVNDWEGLEAEV